MSSAELENNDDKENFDNNEAPSQGAKGKQKPKKRRHVATITKNPESLNARLDTYPLVDPFFAKLNSMVGDINSSKRLMQNIIPSKDSNLKLQQNMKMWDQRDLPAIDLKEVINFEEEENVEITSVSKVMENLVLRTGLRNYRICDLPLENSDEDDANIRNAEEIANNQTLIGRNNMSAVALQFDINAEVEPVSNERSFVMDFGDMNENDFDDVEIDQQEALNRCRGLKRQPILIEDMQPETSAVLSDYSYRPLDQIGQFWAGPSHWKFRQSRRTNLASIGSRISCATSVSEVQAAQQRPKVSRKKKIIPKSKANLEDALSFEDDEHLFARKKKSRSIQLTSQMISKRWESKKLKLPVDHHVPSDVFDLFVNSKAVQINSNPDRTFTGTDNGDGYNYDNEVDRNYCSRVDVQSDTETETNTDMGQMDNNMEFEMGDMLPPPALPQQLDEIPDYFQGAPDRINKINIAFAKRAKVVDMKQLKNCSFNLINQKFTSNPLNNPHFLEVVEELPKVLSKTTAENMSLPLAFYAMLHLCNDKNLELIRDNDLRDFEIQRVE